MATTTTSTPTPTSLHLTIIFKQQTNKNCHQPPPALFLYISSKKRCIVILMLDSRYFLTYLPLARPGDNLFSAQFHPPHSSPSLSACIASPARIWIASCAARSPSSQKVQVTLQYPAGAPPSLTPPSLRVLSVLHFTTIDHWPVACRTCCSTAGAQAASASSRSLPCFTPISFHLTSPHLASPRLASPCFGPSLNDSCLAPTAIL